MNFRPTPLAATLIEARRRKRLAPFAPQLVPASISDAMSVQKEVAEGVGASVCGWKVGYSPDGVPVAGPIYGEVMHRNGAAVPLGPSGRSGIEVEIALRLGKDLPPRPGQPYRRAEILDACQALLMAVEIVEGRFPDPPKPPFLALLADNSSNGAFVCGTELRDFRKLDLSGLLCKLALDGKRTHEAVGGHAKGDPLIPVIDYVNRPCDMLGGLRDGQIVTTGTLSGCPFVEGGVKVLAELEGLGEIAFEIVS
ncbi:MAG: fumarylacetoacetate hydrolase family protein [Hyphomicrobiales bacterium]|nr:fumarylacetoacetate hydrolase family protein [Hyphomicrobiales bacterium]